MKRLLFCAALLSTAAAATADDRELEAAAIAGKFVGQLKPQLKQALQTGSPAQAIQVCADVAPAIAAALSGETGWSVKRVSLKPRNPNATPDEWERDQLRRFDEAVKAGASVQPVSEVVEGRLRYLAPQRVAPLCLVCHGEAVDAQTAAALQHYYPEDTAIGYRPGDVRGAISLTSPPAGKPTAQY